MSEPSEEQAIVDRLSPLLTEARRERIEQVLARRTRYLSLVLEDIYQPHNAAAALRSCEAFGIQDVHVIENRYDFDETRGVSMGAEKWLSLTRWKTGSETCLKTLKARGYQLAALTLGEGAIELDQLELSQPTALLIGTELTGLSDCAHAQANHLVYLPMRGFTQSFNLSVCAALSLGQLRSKLEAGTVDWQLSEEEKRQLRCLWYQASVRSASEQVERLRKEREQPDDPS